MRIKRYLLTGLLACTALMSGCSDGSDGKAGIAGMSAYELAVMNGFSGTEQEWLDSMKIAAAAVEPESCAVCHRDAGADHQAVYNAYKNTSFNVTIDSVSSVDNGNGTYTSTMLFTITKNGQPYVDAGLSGLNQKRYYGVAYDSATKKFNTSFQYSNPKHLGSGQYEVKSTNAAFAPESSNAFAYVYIAAGKLQGLGSHYELYDDVFNVGKAFGNVGDYASVAAVSGCEKCHGAPYRKHGYRMADVGGLPDFVACKACHTDGTAGGHRGWQVLVDNPELYLELTGTYANENAWPADVKAKYDYKRSVMNDVHMSHAMEFAYPQSMANCTTCHEGQIDATLADANFTLTTCKSCHPVDGPEGGTGKRAPALKTIWADKGVASFHNVDMVCNSCHKAGGNTAFSKIHSGYDSKIYAADGSKYSDIFTVAIDEASVSGNTLTIKFSAAKNIDVTTLAAADIAPTVLVAMYGHKTKDFVGRITATKVSGANGNWEYTADLTDWAAKIAAGAVKRAEIAVRPVLKNAAGVTLALNAPSRTFDLAANAFADGYYSAIVDVQKCNACHDALATTFHSPDRGGNVVVCRICHVPGNGGSHLEMQSRSIDSYVHAIHSFQPFDIGDIDFTDAVEELHYEHHIESTYPNFTILNCESCHNAGTYDVPDQSKSLPGVLSAADAVTTKDRNIGAVPSYVTGPASRACGSCHRAVMINEDEAGELVAFNQHTKANGYLVQTADGVLDTVIDTIMALFK